MVILYKAGIALYHLGARVLSLMNNTKARDFTEGRKETWRYLEKKKGEIAQHKVIWFHIASLGEYEQALPVIRSARHTYPGIKIAVSFFSPSGMNHARTAGIVDYKFYLPKDTAANAAHLLAILQPEAVFFVKYDLWHFYITACYNQKIPLFLISAHFRKDHSYFKPWGGFQRNLLRKMTHIFTQNRASYLLLKKHGICQCTAAGDTRVDAVLQSRAAFTIIPALESLLDGSKRLLALGSSWSEDLELWSDIIPSILPAFQIIIAPHNTAAPDIISVENLLDRYSTQRITQQRAHHLPKPEIILIDTIGMLKHIYHYTEIVWIGGGFNKSGIHNTLEPAVHNNAILFGPHYKKFPEALEMIEKGGAVSTTDPRMILSILSDVPRVSNMAKENLSYIQEHAGASEVIMQYVKKYVTG